MDAYHQNDCRVKTKVTKNKQEPEACRNQDIAIQTTITPNRNERGADNIISLHCF
jgi:hypothetical protein